MFGIPQEGWIAIGFWLFINIFPWTYAFYFMKKIDDSGVERWGAKKK